MFRSLRILSLTITVAFLMLGLKIGEIMHSGKAIVVSLGEEANAQQQPSESAIPPKAGDPTAKADNPPPIVKPATSDDPDDDTGNKKEFSQVEVDILQSLAKRREKLDDWAKQIQLKENMLIATEQRLNDKIETLQKMKKELEDLLAQYNEQEDIKIRSLVKIYENMKPKDAARIFEELDMPVLLTVVDRMSERKVSPILAAMSPLKAKDVTVQLAEQRKLQKERPGAAAAAAAQQAAPPVTQPAAGR